MPTRGGHQVYIFPASGCHEQTKLFTRPRQTITPLARPGRLPDRQEALFVRTGLRRTHPPVRNRPSPPHHPRQARLLRLLLALPVLLRLVALSAGAELKAEQLLYPVAGGGRVPPTPLSLTCGGPFSFACGGRGPARPPAGMAPRGDSPLPRLPPPGASLTAKASRGGEHDPPPARGKSSARRPARATAKG